MRYDAPSPIDPGRPAGLLPRFVARAIDVAFLGFSGVLLTFIAPSLERGLKMWSLLIGTLALLVYTAVLQSGAGGGQTLGDRVMGLRVMTPTRAPLGFSAAFTRSFLGVFIAVCCLLMLTIPFIARIWFSRVMVMESLFCVAVLGGCFLTIPCHPLGRGLHDILTDTIVVEGNYPDPMFLAAHHDEQADRRIARALCGGIIAIAVVQGILL